ncbi:MAG: adenylate/guanylate cyclase domain-containing protein [Anaerolineales bacterium]|nr:adenylate/guanylate cyclase domain-containing protein [Anaerolineales bacterium]
MNAPPAVAGKLLIVDDNEDNRIVLARRLERQGHEIFSAQNGREALDVLETGEFDLVLLDIMMPEMNGYQVLECLKRDKRLRSVPVIVISAVDELDSVVRCIELGAEDYLTKPFNRVMLKARISAILEKKQLRDQEKEALRLLEIEREKSERLLSSILPDPIADRLKQNHSTIADSFSDATVLFADIADFTRYVAEMTPEAIVELLEEIFSVFDRLTDVYGLEKIKTVGDAYMVVGGLPKPMPDHTQAVACMALAMMREIEKFDTPLGEPFSMRIGVHAGPVVAGVIGSRRFLYDLWGDTVNVASRMESHGLPGRIQTTEIVHQRLKEDFSFQPRGLIPIKGRGELMTYFILDRKN